MHTITHTCRIMRQIRHETKLTGTLRLETLKSVCVNLIKYIKILTQIIFFLSLLL